MRHVMKVGPLRLDRGTASAYVAFGETGLDVVIETDDDQGLLALARRNKGDVLVCEPALSHAALRRGLTVAAPPPAALSMKAALAVNLDHGRAMAQVSPELVLELIEATIDFEAAAPWRSFEPDEPITVRIQPDGRELEGCVLGQAGEEFGLVLYHRPGSIQKVLDFADQGAPEKARSLDATTILIERGDEFAVTAIEEMTGVAAAPRVLHLTHGRVSPASANDVAGLVAALRAVTSLTTGEVQASGRSVGSGRTVVADALRWTASNTPTIKSYDGVGRNELCPCGSGKKFKRCHLRAVNGPTSEVPTAGIHERDERVVHTMLEFGARRFGADAITRMVDRTFGKRGLSLQLVGPLIAYELPLEGKPIAAHFLEAAPKGTSAEDRTWIERQLETRLSIWEVLAVEHSTGMEVVDLLTGHRCFVHEVLASQGLLPRLAILGRVVLGDRNVFCGMHESPLGPIEADEVVQSVRTSPLAADLIATWREVLEKLERKAKTPTTVRNTDGHDVANVEDQFAIARGAFQRVVATLAALDGVIVDDSRAKGARLTFTRPGNEVHPSWANTVIGTARLTPTRLVVTTNSLERAEILAQRLRVELAELATWKKREREALPTLLGGETVTMDAQAMEAAGVADAFREWLDSPSPLLAGRTPRDGVADEEGRRVVHVMLKDLEYRHARQPDEGVDPSQWRRELGLDLLGQPLAHLELERAIGAGRKLTETLLDFARPMLEALPARADKHGIRAQLEFSIRIWNAVVAEETGGSEPYLAEIRAELVAGRAPSEIIAWLDKLVARKRERFGGDLRFVGNWDLRQDREGVHVEMETRVPASLQAKLKSAGYKANG